MKGSFKGTAWTSMAGISVCGRVTASEKEVPDEKLVGYTVARPRPVARGSQAEGVSKSAEAQQRRVGW
jgi:hypothetical protein